MTDATPTPRGTLAFIYDRQMSPTVGVLVVHLEVCKMRAQDEGWDIAGVFVDKGDAVFSDDNRPAFDAMLEAMTKAAAAGWQVVCLVADWHRLSRDDAAQAAFRARIRTAGGYTATGVGEDDRTGSPLFSRAEQAAL